MNIIKTGNSINSLKYVNNPSFQHYEKKNQYNKKDKLIVAATTLLGVGASLAILAKHANYSLNPKGMYSYLAKTDYKAPEIISIGAGSCIGGLAGGYLIDKDKLNRKSKAREALLQIGNISIPILTVDLFVDKIFKNASKWVKAIAGLGGILAGVYLANIVMNTVNNWLFNNNDGRKVKATDYSAHLDDVVAAAGYIAPTSTIVHGIGRVIPIALMVAGNEIGRKQSVYANNNHK